MSIFRQVWWWEHEVCVEELMGAQWKQCQTLFFGAPKSLQIVTAAMKLKDTYTLEEKFDQPRQHIKKVEMLLCQQRSV